MKKMNYVRPLAEVIELDDQDIVTVSPAEAFIQFDENRGDANNTYHETSGDYVVPEVGEDGKIILPGLE